MRMGLVNGLMGVVVVVLLLLLRMWRHHLLGVHHQRKGLHEISGRCNMGCTQGVCELRMVWLPRLLLLCTTTTKAMTMV